MLTKKAGKYLLTRLSAGLGHKRQKHKSAPTNRGTWAFFHGYKAYEIAYWAEIRQDRIKCHQNAPKDPEKYEDWYAKQRHVKWRSFWIPADEFVYVGWTKNGIITRSGYFNSGDWNYISLEDAAIGLRKMMVNGGYRTEMYGPKDKKVPYTYKGYDAADLQIYIPSSVKL